MSNLPPEELLNATHRFPGKFVFKAIGHNNVEFADSVIETVRTTLVLDFDPPYELRQTPGGRHVSITVEPWVEDARQALDVYQRICDLPGLVMLL